MIPAMFRLVLIALMLLQPLQWAWSAVHATADAAHALSHQSQHQSQISIEPIHKAASCGLVSGAANGHACHDNHTHSGMELGLSGGNKQLAQPFAATPTGCRHALLFDSACLATIDRPKWFATR